jgi:hypothetical protein
MSGLQTCHYIIVDAFPTVEGPHFERFAGAAVGCWIASDISDVDALIVTKLKEEGWDIGKVIDREVVSSETYKNKANGRTEFEQAVRGGFAAHVHRRARETMVLDDSLGPTPMREASAKAYREFLDQLRTGACSLIDDEQWANGVSPDGDDFFPLWSNESEARTWRTRWPHTKPRLLSITDLLGPDGLLCKLDEENMWAAICVNGSLVTTHPLRLERDLAQ